jgi:hypothetical protein
MLQTFQNRLQLTIHRIQPVPESVSISPTICRSNATGTKCSPSCARIADDRSSSLALLDTIFADEAVALAYRTAPAAKPGITPDRGLIEHVLAVPSRNLPPRTILT